MRIVLIHPWMGETRTELLTRGGVKITRLLQRQLETRGHEVIQLAPSKAADAPPSDVLIWHGGCPIRNARLFESLHTRRAYVWRHGDESLHALAPLSMSLDEGCASLLVPTQASADSVQWHVRKAVLYSALEAPHVLDVPSAFRKPSQGAMLHVGAWDHQKGTDIALRVARLLPEQRFIFRAIDRHTASRWIADKTVPRNVEVLPPTPDSADLWAGVSGVLVTSIFETFCMIAYEAVSRGLPVVARWLPEVWEWLRYSESCVKENGKIYYPDSLARDLAAEISRQEREPYLAMQHHALARVAYANAMAQLDGLLC